MGHTGQIVSRHIWEHNVSLFMFCWSWFKFTVVHIWRAELGNSWAVTGNTVSSVSANRHEAIGQADAPVSSALSEQTGPRVKVPSHSLPAQPPNRCDHFWGIFARGGWWRMKLFLCWSAINYWDQVCRKKYYCLIRTNESIRKNMGVSVLLQELQKVCVPGACLP